MRAKSDRNQGKTEVNGLAFTQRNAPVFVSVKVYSPADMCFPRDGSKWAFFLIDQQVTKSATY